MADEIERPDRPAEYVRDLSQKGGRVIGFGSRVYKAEDPRATHLREQANKLSESLGQPEWFQALSRLPDDVMVPYRAKGVYVNVDFYAGAVYSLVGIPEDLFINIFAIGRIPGWSLQVLEQYKDNVLIRPLLKYEGPMDLEYVPIEKRG